MNSTIREFEDGLINYINQSKVPIEVKRLVIKDVFYQVEKTAQDIINQELLLKVQKETQSNTEEATE